MKTRVTELLGIKYPIIEGGMAYIGDGRLAAAVSNAGGFGQVGFAGRSEEDFAKQIDIAHSMTQLPFGVNLPIGEFSDPTARIAMILEKKSMIRAVSLSAGNPKPFIRVLRDAGLIVFVVVSTPLQAKKAMEAGASAVIAEGAEAGGHNGPAELTTLALLPLVADTVTIPVIAAGGICDGRTIASALALGADGVQIGTRFIATEECCAHEQYKQALIQATGEQTVIIERSIGRSTRVLQSPYTEYILQIERQTSTADQLYPYIKGSLNKTGAMDGDLARGYVYASQGSGLIKHILPVSELVDKLLQETQAAHTRLQNLLVTKSV